MVTDAKELKKLLLKIGKPPFSLDGKRIIDAEVVFDDDQTEVCDCSWGSSKAQDLVSFLNAISSLLDDVEDDK